jgi:hypothetical protein
MARKESRYSVTDEKSRDFGKVFLITEMPATQAEAWAYRAILALMRSGIEIPEDVKNSGMAGIASMGLSALSGIRWDDLKPLLEEMMACVQIIPNPKDERVVRRMIESDVEEPVTLASLKFEVFKLHTDFFDAASLLKSAGLRAELER